MTAPERCVVCGAGPLAPHFSRGGIDYRLCRSCGCVFLAKTDGGVRYDDTYLDSLRSNSQRCRGLNAREQAVLLGRFAQGRPGRLLDVGCGLAEFHVEAERAGWQVSSCDLPRDPGRTPDDESASGRVQYGAPETWRYDAASFDAVTAFSVIEHTTDPGALLARMAGWLRPGGLLLLVTPSLSSWSARLMGRFWPHYHREHLAYFTEPALRRLLERQGFGAIRKFSWHKRVTLDFLLAQAARYFPDALPGAAANILRRLPAAVRSLPLRLPSGSVGLSARKALPGT